MPTLDDYVAELPTLGNLQLNKLDQYLHALEREIGVEIEIKPLADTASLAWKSYFGALNELAEIYYDKESRKVRIFIPESLKHEDPFLYIKIVCHELGHIAAGHPLRVRGEVDKFWWPPNDFAWQSPAADFSRNEREADHRANWSLIFAVLGDRIRDRERNYSAF